MASELNQKQLIQVHKYPLLVKNTLDSFPESILFTDLNDGQIITVDEQVHIRVVHTPGHTKDHCAFYLEEEDTMFTADCILGHGSVSFEDLTEYVGGLKRVQELKPTRLYPGHGDVVDNGMEKVEQYLSLRMAKEKQILDLLCQDTNRTWTPIELVEEMSSKKEHYTEQLIAVVVGTVGLHLIKLYHDGKAEIVDADTFKKTYQIDPYDANNVFSIVNQKWTYTGFINSSKL
jgi:glyoxylase-like metal-dependent hydrolase (beta-lactamase superfamily II)